MGYLPPRHELEWPIFWYPTVIYNAHVIEIFVVYMFNKIKYTKMYAM